MVRRLLRVLLKTLLGLAALLLLVYFLRGPLFGRMLSERIAAELSAALGGRFTVHRVEGNWLTEFAVVGLRTEEPPPDGPIVRLEWARASVRYNPFALIDGDVAAAARSAAVSGARVEIDLTRPAGPDTDGPNPLDALPETLPDLRLDGAVEVKTADATYAAGEIAVAGRGNTLDLALGALAIPQAPEVKTVRARVRRTGPRTFHVASGQEIEGVLLESADVAVPDEGWSVAAVLAVAGGKVAASAGPDGASATLEGIDLKRLPRVESPVSGRAGGTVTVDERGVAFEVALVDVESEGVRVDRVDAAGLWNGEAILVETLEARAGDASVVARRLDLRPEIPFLVHALGSARVRVPDLRAFVPDLEHALSVETDAVTAAAGRVEIPELKIEGADSALTATLVVALPRDPGQWRETRFETATFQGRLGDLNRFASGLPRIDGNIHVSGSVSGTVAAPVAVVVAEGNRLRVEGRAVETVRLEGRLDWPLLEGFQLVVDAEPGRVQVGGVADLAQRTVRDGSFRIDIGNLKGFGALVPDLPPLAGRLEGEGALVWDGAQAAGTATLKGAALVVDGTRIGHIVLEATVRGEEITFRRVGARGPWGDAESHGWVHFGNRKARVEQLTGTFDRWPAKLNRPLDLAWSGGDVTVEGIDVAVAGGRVHGSGAWTGRPAATLRAENLHLDQVDARWKGRADGSLVWKDDTFAVVFDAPQAAFEEHRGRVHLEARQAAAGIEVTRLEAHLGERLSVSGRAVLPYRFADGRFVRAEVPQPTIALDGIVRDVLGLAGVDAARATFRLDGDADGLRGDVRVVDLALTPELELAGETRFHVEATPEGVAAGLAAAPGDLARFDGKLTLDRGVDWTRPEQFRALWEQARVDGEVVADVPDLSVLRRLLDGVRRLEGKARARLAIRGPLREVEVSGFAEVEGLTTVLEGDLPPVQDVAGRFDFDGRAVRTEGLKGLLGYEPLTLSGSVALPPGKPPEFALALAGKNVQLVRDRYLRLRADVDLKLTGPIDALEAAGTARVTDALYSRPVDFLAKGGAAADDKFQLFGIREGPFAKMKLDVRILATESIHVRNNLVRGSFSADIHLRGKGEVPEPEGRVFFRGVLIRLPAASLKIDQGELRFPPESPFAPTLNVAGHTRKRGHELLVSVYGKLPDVEINVSANPSLAQDDAILLLTVGATRADLEQQGVGRAALTQVGAIVGERLVSRVSGPTDPDERSFFDRFQFEMGADVSRSGQETVAGEFEMHRRWYLRVERDRFEDYNAGVVWRIRFR